MEVHRCLGCGFLEAVYQEALALELAARDIPYRREIEIPVSYKENLLATSYRADFVCYENIIIEIKAIKKLGTIEEAQVINYLKAGSFPVGLLLNFGDTSLEYKRLVLTKSV